MAHSKRFKKLTAGLEPCGSTLALSDLHLGRVITHAKSPEVIAPLVEGFERVLLLGARVPMIDGILYLHGHAVYNKLKGDGSAVTRIRAMNEKKYGAHKQNSRSGHTVWKIVEHLYSRIPMAMMLPIKWPLPVVRRIKALADEIAPDGGVRGVVLGHSHRPGVRRYRGMTLYNLGGWMKNTRAYGFMRRGAKVKLVHIDMRAQRLQWGKVLHESELA